MIQDLKLDSQRWRAEAGRGSPLLTSDSKVARLSNTPLVAYKDSRTHESRQYYGPSQTTTTPVEYPQSHDPPRQSYQAPPSSHYSVSDNYTHAPQPQSTYQSVPSGYPSQYHPPRTTPTTSYGGYSQEPPRQTTYQSPEVQYNYYPQQSSEPPRQPPVYSPAPRYFGYYDERYKKVSLKSISTGGARPGYYIASDGHGKNARFF